MIKKELSKNIYSELIIGKFINKEIYDKKINLLIENELFKEIDMNILDYENLYLNLGYRLDKQNNSYYLYKEDVRINDEFKFEKIKVSFKEYVFLLCIIRYLNDLKIDINTTIMNKDNGIPFEIIHNMFKIEETDKYFTILDTTEISETSFKDLLLNRNIFYENKNGNYFLSSIGLDFLKFIENEGKSINNVD